MNKLRGAWNILLGVGMYIQGVQTCGDYMFSGHTVWLTLLTHFITECNLKLLSILVWIILKSSPKNSQNFASDFLHIFYILWD
jgi:hypothetical protein